MSPSWWITATAEEEAKSLTEEEITGALIRSLKRGERNACFLTGIGEHSIDDTDRSGYSVAQGGAGTQQLQDQGASPCCGPPLPPRPRSPPAPRRPPGKIEVPKDCTVLVVAGPQHDYVQPEADAIKEYVEGGGHALFMLDPPLNLGTQSDRREHHAGGGAGRAGASREQGPGARYQRHRPGLRPRSGSAAGGQLRIARHRQPAEGCGHGLPALALAGREERRTRPR